MDPINDKCDVCNAEKKFRSMGVVLAGGRSNHAWGINKSLRLENWMCATCEKFYLLYAKSSLEKSFLISKTYEHKYITISLVYDPFTKDVHEIKIAKLHSDVNLVLSPKQMLFKVDPLHPDEDILLNKLEVYEIFS